MYTDNQLRAFSQVGYMELAQCFESQGGPGKKVKLTSLMTEKDRSELEIRGGAEQDYAQWYVTAVRDKNGASGFYACVLETAPDSAVVCFRGSDRMAHGFADLQHDWVEADLGLLNAASTEQHRDAEQFLRDHKHLLKQYRRITITGHSLGGNLAEYAAIRFVRYGLDGQLEQCVSMDGPGFSDEFISQNKAILRYVCAKMKHYRWSFIGALLNDLPGVAYRFVDVQHVSKADRYNMVTRHDLKYLKTDQKGNFVEGQQDLLSIYFSKLSRHVDGMPKQKGDKIKVALSDLTLKTGRTVYTIAGIAQTIQDTLRHGKKSGAMEQSQTDQKGISL